MATLSLARIAHLARFFRIYGELVEASPFGNGHINDTFLLTFNQAGARTRYLMQSINCAVFRKPLQLMENVQRVILHASKRLCEEASDDATRRIQTLVPTLQDAACLEDESGCFWRVFLFIEDSHTIDSVTTSQQAYESARAFGAFQRLLVDFPKPRLHETIPDFHNTPKRMDALRAAVENDVCNRASQVKEEIDLAFRSEAIAGVLLNLHRRSKIPERITHNDTKINNVLLDSATGKGICVIDLDTVMPGLALYDFGDMVRTAASTAAEDEPDVSKMTVDLTLFKALARGYLDSAQEFLTKSEKEQIAFAGKLITFEQAVRFLTDFLAGDTYYKMHRPGHNLDRARAQFRLFQEIERKEEKLNRIVAQLAG